MTGKEKRDQKSEEDELLLYLGADLHPPTTEEKRAKWMDCLSSDDLEERIEAIDALGELGDEDSLVALRTRLDDVGEEYRALIIAIGTLKWRLGEQ